MDFNNEVATIEKANNLKRCQRCGKLLGKVDGNRIEIKRKDVLMIGTLPLSIQCPVCSEQQEIK